MNLSNREIASSRLVESPRRLVGASLLALLCAAITVPACVAGEESDTADSSGEDDSLSGTATGAAVAATKINFQIAGAAVPTGYQADTGDVFGARANGLSYGWSVAHTDVSRDRNVNADQRLDTLIHMHAGAKWELSVPNGDYDVTVSVGDPSYASTYTVRAEGTALVNNLALGVSQFKTATAKIHVGDGRLTLDQAALADKSTRINYVEVKPWEAPSHAQYGYYVWGSVPMQNNADKVTLPEVRGYGRFYNWSDIQKGATTYNFAPIDADLQYAASIGKRLFVHLREVRYALNAGNVNLYSWVPDYMRQDPKFGGSHPGSYGSLWCPDECANGQTKTNWPRYMDADYQAAWTKFQQALSAHLHASPYFDALEGYVDNETSWGAIASQVGGHGAVTQMWKDRAAVLRAAYPDRTVLISPNWITGAGGDTLKADLYSLIDEHTAAGKNFGWTPPDTNSLLDDNHQHDVLFPKAKQNVLTNDCAYWIQSPDYNFASWRHPGYKVTPEEFLDILRPVYTGEVVPAHPTRAGEKEPRIGFRYVFVSDWNGATDMWKGPIAPGAQKTYPELLKLNLQRRPYPWNSFNSN